jgi:MFS family permease
MQAENTGVWIAMAAILVQAPRLVLAVLAADHQAIAASWERGLLILAGFGTALVLTGGNLYLAHTVARVRRWRGGLVVVWLLVLASTGGLVVPLIAAGIGGRTLPQVLDRHLLAWGWSLLAAVAHEITAAGCMLSAAALASTAATVARERSESAAIDELISQRDAARREVEVLRGRQQETHQLPAATTADPTGRALLAEPGSSAAATAMAFACREGCGKRFASELGEMGHLRSCPARRKRLSGIAAAGPNGPVS